MDHETSSGSTIWSKSLKVCFSVSLFIYCSDVFMEKHWKSVISRSVCDYFFDAQNKSSDGIPAPVIATPHHYLISIHRNNVFMVAVCMSEGNNNNRNNNNNNKFLSIFHNFITPGFFFQFLPCL